MREKDIAIFLCDLSGSMAKPWRDAGYECWLFDAQHPEGVTEKDGMYHVGGWLKTTEDVWKHVDKSKVYFVFGFPECTDLAVSGARHFADKTWRNPNFQDDAMKLVYLCRDVGVESGARWGFENPVSVISTKWKQPNFKFQPYEYGGYLPIDDVHPIYPEYFPPQDAYPKLTCIWSGNGMVEPVRKPVHVSPGYSALFHKLGGKSKRTKNIRSSTPRGFAQAVFEANHQKD